MTPVPTLVRREDKHIVIEWNDGHQSRYSASDLRQSCPCASCQDRPGQGTDPFRILNPQEVSPETVTVQRIEAVGNYALRFYFSDGHNAGIYTYEYLRKLG